MAAAAPAAYDPFSVSGDAHALMGGAPPDTRPLGDIGAWFRKLCTSASGVLYEDSNLQARSCLDILLTHLFNAMLQANPVVSPDLLQFIAAPQISLAFSPSVAAAQLLVVAS